MVANILVVAECPVWDRIHKIRIKVKRNELQDGTSVCAGTMPSPEEVNRQIVKHVVEQSIESNIQPAAISVQVYDPNRAIFLPILDQHIQENFKEIFGTRIRCIISIQHGFPDDKPNHLLIKGRFYDYNSNGMNFAGKTLIIKEEVNNREEDGTGLNVWDGSLLLARYLEQYPEKVSLFEFYVEKRSLCYQFGHQQNPGFETRCRQVVGKSILELGSGPAVVGIAAAILGAKEVILSDLNYTLPLIQKNVNLNRDIIDASKVKLNCREIDWFNPPEVGLISSSKSFPEVMLIADCVWLEELVDPLINTIRKLCRNKTEVIFSYQRRGKATHDLFWARLRELFKVIDDIGGDRLRKLEMPESLSLLICRL